MFYLPVSASSEAWQTFKARGLIRLDPVLVAEAFGLSIMGLGSTFCSCEGPAFAYKASPGKKNTIPPVIKASLKCMCVGRVWK